MATDPEQQAADDLATRSQELVAKIRPILAGHHMAVQSATLADLLAMYLAGHFAGTPEETATVREEILAEHLKLVRDLIEPNEGIILERVRSGSS